MAANGWDVDRSVQLYESAVCKSERSILLTSLWRPGATENKTLLGKARTFPCTLMSELLQEDVLLMKIDMNGPEGPIMSALTLGENALLDKFKVHNFVIEFNPSSWTSFGVAPLERDKIITALVNRGYYFYLISHFSSWSSFLPKLKLIQRWKHFRVVYNIPSALVLEFLSEGHWGIKNIFITYDPPPNARGSGEASRIMSS